MQKRRRLLLESEDRSFLNYVGNSDFNPPNWNGANQGNLLGVAITEDKSKVLLLAAAQAQAPENQIRLRVYALSNSNGIIESPSDLTYLGQTAAMNIEIGGSYIGAQPSLYYNEDLGKIWWKSQTRIVEYDFDINTFDTSFVQSVPITDGMNNGGFYFSPDGYTLYTTRVAFLYNIRKHTLSTAFDIGSISSTITYTFSLDDGYVFAGIPYFYNNGNYAIYLSYNDGSGSGYKNINKKAFGTPYDYSSLITSSGYRNAIYRGSVYQLYNNHPGLGVIFSVDRKKMNLFNSSPSYTGGGRIQVLEFDQPLNFRGFGNELGGVRNLTNGVVIPFE